MTLRDSTVYSGLKLLSWLMTGRQQQTRSYGHLPEMEFDEFPVADASAPIVMFWHGGGWSAGNKKYYRFVGQVFQKMGYRAIIVGHPVFPKQSFPGFISDAQKAIAKVHSLYPNAHIFTSGHSSGGHIALITTMQSYNIVGCIALAAPCHIEKRYWGNIFGNAFDHDLQDPRTYIEKSNPKIKFLLIHGKFDRTVSPEDSVSLDLKLKKHGASSRLIVLFANHVLLLLHLAWSASLKRQIKQFINS